MKNSQKKSDNTFNVLKRFLKVIGKGNIWLTVTIIASLFGGISSILLARGIKDMSNAAMAHEMNVLLNSLYVILIAMGIDVSMSMLKTYSSGRFTNYSIMVFRNICQEHIARFRMNQEGESRSGDLLSRMSNDMREVQWFVSGTLINLLSGIIMFITAITYMFILNWKLTLLGSILMPVFTIIVAKVSKKVESQSRQQQESLGNESNVLQDSFMGLSELKAFGLKKIMHDKYSREVDITTAKTNKMYATELKIQPIGTLCSSLPFVVTMFYGGYLIINHGITLGGLLAYISLSNNVTDPIGHMPQLITAVRSNVACIKRIFEIWDIPSEREDGCDFGIRNEGSVPVISFENVDFSYNEENSLFRSLDFKVHEGEKIALVGSSGCGKSTVLKLITGFYTPDSGKIKIYGHDISEWKLEGLRSTMSEVLQDNYLFPDTILKNISYGKENAGMEEVEAASRSAYIYDFIQGLPNKYETLVGERGVRLSGGQRQRVAIARALLKNAPILLLDEATSALDTESEKEVQIALEKLMAGRTTLVIAHRLSTIKNADRILVMDNGRIVEIGTHNELISKDSLYSQLYNNQFKLESGFYQANTAEG